MLGFRNATEADYGTIQDMHAAQNLGYPLPPLGDRSIVVKLLAENDGKAMFAGLLRLTSEAYLIGAPQGTPAERWDAVRLGNYHLMKASWDAGFSDINCVLPPRVAKSFGKRLERLGWEKNEWPHYSIWPGSVFAHD